ncbi:MAG: OB-fold nucleic acid binding domain-containing protein [Candidatus Binatia bacterium]
MKKKKYFWPLLLVTAVLIGGACENIALVGRDPVAPESRRNRVDRAEITGMIDDVDPRLGEVHIRTAAGRTRTVYYNPDTRVIIRGRDYPPTALRRDDEVTVQLQSGNRGYDAASLIRVHEQAQTAGEASRVDRPGAQTIEGTVERVDRERGYFEIRPRFGSGTTRVFLPYNPLQRTEDQFRRLREGDYVRVEGELVSDNRVELKTFL